MSFPKAKLKRFNEVSVTSPSPAKYNVNNRDNPKCGFISQGGRFTEAKSAVCSESASTQSTPCFRTPTLIKKKKVFTISKVKPENTNPIEDEVLKEKIVECNNKDIFIKELIDQLEELKQKIHNLKYKVEMLEQEKENFGKNISDLKEYHSSETDTLTKQQEKEISILNEKILQIEKVVESLKNENEKLKETIETLQGNHQVENSLCIEQLELKNRLIEEKELTLKQMERDRDYTLQEHKTEIEKLNVRHQKELQNLEFEMLKCVSDAHKSLDEQKRQHQQKVDDLKNNFSKEIEDLKQSFSSEKDAIKEENLAHIKHIEENMTEMRMLSEIQASEKYTELQNYWKSRLEKQEEESAAILKECQAISEYNIIQSEIEKNGYKSQLGDEHLKYKDLEKKYDDVYFQYKKLQANYSNVQNKLYRMLKELREKDTIVYQVNKLLNEKQTYETTVLRCQETIDILKRRLRESDQDVEQLKNEISDNEKKILGYEHKLNVLVAELGETRTLIEELEMNNESTMKTTREEIKMVKDELLKKVQDFKIKAEEAQIKHAKEITIREIEKNEYFQIIKEQKILNDNARALLHEVNLELETLLSENSEYSERIEKLTSENVALQNRIDNFIQEEKSWIIERKELDLKIDILKNEIQQLRKHEITWKNASDEMVEMRKTVLKSNEELKMKCIRINELEKEVQGIKIECEDLEKTNKECVRQIEEHKVLIAPFKDQLEAYELEMRNLQSAKDHMENEARDLGVKYATVLGHQNHKQKIKYMVNLKSKNEDLQKVNLELESKLKIQDKKMEKLRKENVDLKRSLKKSIFEDKENIGSPNRSFKCESPGPLREIN